MFKKIIYSNLFYLFVIIIFVLIQLFVSFQFREKAIYVADINYNFEDYVLKNQLLKAKILKFMSLTTIEKSAKKIGFVPVTKIVYFEKMDNLAKKL